VNGNELLQVGIQSPMVIFYNNSFQI